MRRALVLGGGGVTGLAWEIGLVAGLTEGGVRLGSASDVIGTSAGSVVGTGTHADRALEREAQSVLIVAAFDERTPGIGGLMRHELDSEAARLREAGARVAVITPSLRAGEIVGNAMDPSLRAAAVDAGLEQGRAEASGLEDWGP